MHAGICRCDEETAAARIGTRRDASVAVSPAEQRILDAQAGHHEDERNHAADDEIQVIGAIHLDSPNPTGSSAMRPAPGEGFDARQTGARP